MKTRQLLLLFTCLVISLSACKPKMLPNSSVPDTRDNRRVVDFLVKYQEAIQSRDVEKVMTLVSPDYSDKATQDGPPAVRDLVDLREKLLQSFKHVKDLSMAMHLQNVEHDGSNYKIVYYYVEHILVSTPSGEEWKKISDVNRMQLVRQHASDGPDFLILSGI